MYHPLRPNHHAYKLSAHSVSTGLLVAVALLASAAPAHASPPLPPLTLAEAIERAGEKNTDLRQVRARLKQADEASSKVLANYLPQITASGAYTRNQYAAELSLPTRSWVRTVGPNDQNGPPSDPSHPELGAPSGDVVVPDPAGVYTTALQKQDQFTGQLQLQQAILVPALWPAFKVADLSEEVATLGAEAARREVLFGVASLYYGAATLRELIAVQERLLQSSLEHEQNARVQVESGAAPKIVLVRAQIDRARAEQDLTRAQKSYELAKVALATMLDRGADFEVVRPEEPVLPADLVALESSALTLRPDVAAARVGRELAARAHDANSYQYLPALFGRANYQAANLKGFTNAYGQWSVSLIASWTLWDGGLRESALRESAARRLEAEAALHGAELKAEEEVRRARIEVELARANRTKAEEQLKLAHENMRLVDTTHLAGEATQLEVSDATAALAAAEVGAVAESLNSQLAALKLLKASGRFQANPNPNPNR